MIRLPRRFVKSLVEQQRKPIIPQLKVQLSSELLHRLSQSIYQPIRNEQKHSSTDKFTIQSQFGSIIASFNPDERNDRSETRAVRARMEVKSRLPPVRHLAKSRTELLDRRKTSEQKHLQSNTTKHRSDRRKKRHIHRWKNSPSRQDSSTNMTQTRDTTLLSEEEPSNRTSDVIQQRNHRKTMSKE